MSVLQDVRNNIGKHHDEWYSEYEEACSIQVSGKAVQMTGASQQHASDPLYHCRCIQC